MASKGNNSDVKSKRGGFGAGQIKITPLQQTAVTINLSGTMVLSYCL